MAAPSRLEKTLTLLAVATVAMIYASVFFVRPIADLLRGQNLLRLAVVVAFLAAGGILLRLRLKSGRPGWREVAVLVFAVAVWLFVLRSIRIPEERFHLLEYGVLAGMIYEAARLRQKRLATRIWPALTAAVVALAIGWGEEGLQFLAPDRYYDLSDVMLNGIAAVLAVFTLAALRRARRPDARS